jgi:secondary thiamine-phosphate synthase enzyme
MTEINVKTVKRSEMVNITRELERCVSESGVKNGIAVVFVPHTTAGVAVSEDADPDVTRDINYALQRAVPNTGFYHSEGNSDAHTKAVITGPSVSVIIENSRPVLGAWQGLYLCEYDGPRQRRVYIKTVSG